MASIHPSEQPPLGHLVPCLAVEDLAATTRFYGRFDLAPYGGDPAEGWVMLRNRQIELHLFRGHIPRDLLNFRGGDLPAIRAALADRGLPPPKDMDGASFLLEDPDGREVYFDSSPGETEAYLAGHPVTGVFEGEDVYAGPGVDLGSLRIELGCADVERTAAFYFALGLVRAPSSSGAAVLARPDHLPRPGARLASTHLALRPKASARLALSFVGAASTFRDAVDPQGRPVRVDP